MCDTLVVVKDDRIWFAKNSDRDANEAQVLRWVPAKSHDVPSEVRCTWRSIPQVKQTYAVVLSSPFWMWGAEMGANQHGVVIGNQAVFTKNPIESDGLLGMDILRLALERSATSVDAVKTIRGLVEEHGQGGRCGYVNENFSYHNSFLVADKSTAWVVETAGREVAVEQIKTGARAISNGLSIRSMRHHAKAGHEWVGECKHRRKRAETLAANVVDVSALRQVLADHGEGQIAPKYKLLNGALSSPCAHAGGALVSTQTVGSWISELTANGSRHWATGTSAPCLSLFKPIDIFTPIDLGVSDGRNDPSHSFWWEFEGIHREAIKNFVEIDPAMLSERDELESDFFRYDRAESVNHAWDSAKQWQEFWYAQIQRNSVGADCRPFYIKSHWEKLNRQSESSLLDAWKD